MTIPTSSRPSKRAKTTLRGDDDYGPGNIVEIEVQNFMTYGYIKSKPGPRLNLVIGPNGTGKSSLVCAICLGLAGEPQLLGRATTIGDFVKRGEESGWTKISLRGNSDADVVVITRKINTRNKTDWLLNDRPVSKKEIQDVVRGFNIQLNNLTQFLPQDRVCEFAKLSPIELLEETEKAVGDPELSAQHRTLIVKSEDLKKLQTTVTQLESTLAQSKANGRELEEDGQRLRQRNEFLAKAESLKKKVVWLQYDEKRVDYQARKEAEAVAKTKLRDALTQQQELQAPLLALRSEKQVAEEASKKLLGLKSTSESRLRQIADQESEMGSRARAQLTDIQEVNKREALRQQRIESAQQDVALAEAEYANLPEYQPPKEQIRDIAAKIEYFQMQGLEQKQLRQEKEANIGQLSRSLDQCNRRLQDINSVKSRLLHTLKNAGAHGIFEAYEWVQSQRHQNKFKNEVYGPVLLEVQIPDKSNAAYIENHVPNHIWRSFITLDAEDRDYCAQHLRQHGCPIINQKQVQRGDPPPLTNEMRELGITMRLDQAISGPEVVKEVLCGQAALDYSFIGTSEANLRADEAPRLGVQDLWTPENHYRWQKSRYGGHISTSVGSVRPVRLFSENVDAKEKIDQERRKADYEARIKLEEDEIRNCNTKFREIEEEAAKQHRLREELTNQVRMERRKRQDMINVIEQRKKKLLMYVNEESSASAEAKLRESIKDINLKRYENVIKLKEVMLGAIDKQTKYAAYHLNVIELDSKVKEMEKDLKGQEQACTQLQRDYENRKHATEIARTALQRAMEEAEELASLTPELQAEFSTMPDSVAELLEAVQECVSSAGAVICNNPNVLEEYERRCKQIQSLTDKVEKERASLDQCLKDIETTQTLWLPRLKDLVRKINETFSRNFMDMAVAGEVSLDEHGTDFDKYGIMIKVKFRETAELQVLSAHHQSGGERSVSTILYLVSLQDLTYCPFRVVDEINQGMDPNNERKMFQQLVRAASQPNTPQCFLLTPKLLPDLEYTEACTVLNIMNGPWLDGASQVWSVGESWSYMSQMICSQ